MRKVAAASVLVMLLMIFAGCAGRQTQMAERDVRFDRQGPGVLTVMTFNVRVDTFLDGLNRWGNRREIVIDTIAGNAPDVFGVQEAFDFQVGDIARALGQYGYYAAGRDDGRSRGEACAILFRKDRFDLVDSATFWFADTPSKAGSRDWGSIFPRICSWVYLREKSSGSGLYVYNVHMDNLSQRSREKSAELLAERIANRKTKEPFIVMGDFNMEADNSAMQYLLNAGKQRPHAKMVDTWPTGRSNEGTLRNLWGTATGPKLDHILVSEDIDVLEASIDRRNENGKYPSDHFPVIAKIRVPIRSNR